MNLYLIRHGIAEDAGEKYSDAQRPLTREGVKKFRQAVEGFMTLSPPIDLIFSSPLTRARQTADILAHQIEAAQHYPISVQVCPSLAPPDDLKAFLAGVFQINPAARGVAAIGHDPILSRWIAALCGGGHGQFEMKKGAIAGIELTGKQHLSGELFMLAPPALLRQMAR
jgi:phosphohistidine phosphatase